MGKQYRCLYNLDMGMIPSHIVPVDGEEITREGVEYYVKEVANTDVDAYMACPTYLRLPLWRSSIEPHWRDIAPEETEPVLPRNFIETTYYRIRRYILKGGDPVGDIVNACKKYGIAAFFSYRMNDIHHTYDPGNKNLDAFWREHPELYIGEGWAYAEQFQQDYMRDEVREHYFRLLEELTEMYDIDGLELDFMRGGRYFKAAEVSQGMAVMTEFVRRVRNMLDRYGRERGKTMSLCVRVPHCLEWARGMGLDVEGWAGQGLVDMINVTSPNTFTTSVFTGIKTYKEAAANALIYGELYPFINHNERITTINELTTAAHHLLSEGADGISFFNYPAHHKRYLAPTSLLPQAFHNELRPSDLRSITDREALADLPRHYFIYFQQIESIRPDAGLKRDRKLPIQMWEFKLKMHEWRDKYRSAALRVEMAEACHGFPLIVVVNGRELTEFIASGELFPPDDITNLPSPHNTRFYSLPTDILSDENTVEIRAYDLPGNTWDKKLTIAGCEIALYKEAIPYPKGNGCCL